MLTKWKDNLFNSFIAIVTKRDSEGVLQWAATQARHSKASISGGLSRHRAGIALRGALGDIWLQLREGQMCRFDGKETCQLRKPAWQRRHIRGNTSPDVGTPLSFCKAQSRGGSGGSSKSTCSICMGESSNARYKIKKGRKWTQPALSLASCQLRRRSYQSPPALLNCSKLTGE